jgi:RHS repeat-associated protein
MQMPGRQSSLVAGDEHKYGFQGQEMDDEIKGEGNSVNYKFRMHDPRVGRFFATDPLKAKYPHNSPYAFSENRVIDGIDFEGLEFYGAQQSLVTALTDGYGRVPTYQINISKLKSDFTVKAFTDLYNLAYLPEKKVERLTKMRECTIATIVDNVNQMRDNPAEFKGTKLKSAEFSKNVDKAMEQLGHGNSRFGKSAKGLASLLFLAQEVISTQQRTALGNQLVIIREHNDNFQKAVSAATFAVDNGFINPKYMGAKCSNCVSNDPNMQLKVDLTNWIMDGTMPKGDLDYQRMVEREGKYLYDRIDKIGSTMFHKGVEVTIVPRDYTPTTKYQDSNNPNNYGAPTKINIEYEK